MITAIRPALTPALFARPPVACGQAAPAELYTPGEPPPPAVHGSLKVNGQEGASMQAGQPALWRFSFTDENGQPITRWEAEHEKPMHAIILSHDLETFAHVHPGLSSDGSFFLPVNQAVCDPDNRDTASAVRKGGSHRVFVECKPEGRDVQVHRFTVEAAGCPSPVTPVADPVSEDGIIRKYFKADGQPGQAGDPYLVSIRVEDHRQHGMVHVNYNLMKRGDGPPAAPRVLASAPPTLLSDEPVYEPVRNVENWLGMKGHGGFAGSDGFFAHLHAGHHRHAGPDFMFMLHGEMPPDGVYKMWGQFKHEGEVRTFPVTFALRSAPA